MQCYKITPFVGFFKTQDCTVVSALELPLKSISEMSLPLTAKDIKGMQTPPGQNKTLFNLYEKINNPTNQKDQEFKGNLTCKAI